LLDSTQTHAFIKLTTYPFLIPRAENNLGGSFALGPCISISGEKFEMQLGILYDIAKYKGWYHPLHTVSSPIEYHRWYLPLIFNYFFRISETVNCFPSLGGGFLSSKESNNSRGWLFAGGGICCRLGKD
jgi:hypothetical protein